MIKLCQAASCRCWNHSSAALNFWLLADWFFRRGSWWRKPPSWCWEKGYRWLFCTISYAFGLFSICSLFFLQTKQEGDPSLYFRSSDAKFRSKPASIGDIGASFDGVVNLFILPIGPVPLRKLHQLLWCSGNPHQDWTRCKDHCKDCRLVQLGCCVNLITKTLIKQRRQHFDRSLSMHKWWEKSTVWTTRCDSLGRFGRWGTILRIPQKTGDGF